MQVSEQKERAAGYCPSGFTIHHCVSWASRAGEVGPLLREEALPAATSGCQGLEMRCEALP